MLIGILAAVFGVLIAAVAITIPRVINRGNNPQDHTDSYAYLKATGRSGGDVARSNTGRTVGHETDAGSQQPNGSR
jgi:hypothetical protein